MEYINIFITGSNSIITEYRETLDEVIRDINRSLLYDYELGLVNYFSANLLQIQNGMIADNLLEPQDADVFVWIECGEVTRTAINEAMRAYDKNQQKGIPQLLIYDREKKTTFDDPTQEPFSSMQMFRNLSKSFEDRQDLRRRFKSDLKALFSSKIVERKNNVTGEKSTKKDIYVESQLIKSQHREREKENAYLRKVIHEHSFWNKVFVEVTTAVPSKDDRSEPEDLFVMEPDIASYLLDIATAIYSEQSPISSTESTSLDDFAALSEALERFQSVAIIGDPGAGKTTILRRLAHSLAKIALENEAEPLPLYVPLGDFNLGELDIYLEKHFGGLQLVDYLPDRVVILLDGLNEVSPEKVRDVQNWIDAKSNTRIVVTCRKLDYYERNLKLQRIDVLPLDLQQIRTFMVAYKLDDAQQEQLFWDMVDDELRELWNIWKKAGLRFENFWYGDTLKVDHPAYKYTSDRQDRIYNAMREKVRNQDEYPGLLGLMRNPFILTITIAIFVKTQSIPRNKAYLLKAFSEQLIRMRGKLSADRDHPWIDEGVQIQALSKLAYYMQREEKRTSIELTEATGIISQLVPTVDPDRIIYFLASAGVIDKGLTLRFVHQLMQEYFAALALKQEIIEGRSALEVCTFDETSWVETFWGETAILLAGLYPDDMTPVINWLKDIAPELTARCIAESGAIAPISSLDNLRSEWLPRLNDTHITPPARASIGRSLGILQLDDRTGVGLDDRGMPDIEWVEIPEGEFVLGSNNEIDNMAMDSEVPAVSLYHGAFRISKYPITYQQFEAFVNDGGYRVQKYWTVAGWDWKKNINYPGIAWTDPYFHISNHPVIGITWYEAVAFCLWLSEKVGYEIRLPTELEWEKAARGIDSDIYPYGSEFDAQKGNYLATEIGRPCCVGMFPNGASSYGVMDMSGNVWEWCQNAWPWKYTTRFREELNTTETKVMRAVRGGGYANNRMHVRATCRFGNPPDFRLDDLGFRIVSR